MILIDVLEYLKKNKYILVNNKEYVLSRSFQLDAKRVQNGMPLQSEAITSQAVSVPEKKVSIVPFEIDWKEMFISFIRQAQVPAKLEGSRGESYSANMYNEKAMLVFKKALESGTDLGLLVKSTTLYYKSSTRFRKTIANYIIDGDWVTGYNALKEAAETGEEELKDYIKNEVTDDNSGYGYIIG